MGTDTTVRPSASQHLKGWDTTEMVAQGFRIGGVLFRECAQSPTCFLVHFVDGDLFFRGKFIVKVLWA